METKSSKMVPINCEDGVKRMSLFDDLSVSNSKKMMILKPHATPVPQEEKGNQII